MFPPHNSVCLFWVADHESLQDYWRVVALTCDTLFWDLIISPSDGNTIERGLSAVLVHINFFSKVDESFVCQ